MSMSICMVVDAMLTDPGCMSRMLRLRLVSAEPLMFGGGWCKSMLTRTAAALNVTEPSSTGIGGDMFCLYYDAKTKTVSSLNGSGRYAGNVTLDTVRNDLGIKPGNSGRIPVLNARAATTPGAAAGWVDTVERFGSGKLSLEQILLPAIELGEEGFPVVTKASFQL